ncbi:MAG: lipopolysaccharide biosynthesis protein [Candidatus Limimorpha sp.]
MGVVIRQSIKGTVMNYMGVAVGIFTTFFVLTKYFTTEQVGLTKVLVDSAILLSTLAQLGTNSSAMRYYPYFKDEKNRDNGFFGWTLILPIVGFVLFILVFFIFKTPLVQYFAKQSRLFVDYMHFVFPMAFFMLYLSVFETNSNLLMRIVVPKFIREVGVRLMTLADYLLFALGVISLNSMVIGLCLVYLVATLLNIIYLFSLKRVSFRTKRSYVSPWLRRDFTFYTLFLILSSLTTIVVPMLNTFFITAEMGLVFTGINTIAQYMANMIEIPYRSLGSISRPAISESFKNNDIVSANTLARSVSLHQFMAGLFIFFLIWINIDFVYLLLPNGASYSAGKWVFFILALGKLFNSTMSIGGTALGYSKFYYWSLAFTVVLITVSIVLNNILVPRWGMQGSAMASLLAFIMYYSPMLLFVRIKVKVKVLSRRHLWIFTVVASLFMLDFLWSQTVELLMLHAFQPLWLSAALNAMVKTLLFVLLGIYVTYRIGISQQVNDLIDRLLRDIHIR